jgi:transposase
MSATVIRYSESFKLQVVRDLEGGRFANIGQAASHYGIKGSVTIRGWLIKFGKDRLMPRVVRVETPEEQHELKRLRQRVRQLEGLLADKELGLVISETYLELACERAGILDVEDFKKRSLGVCAERGRAARAKSEGDVQGLGYDPAKLLSAEAAAAMPGSTR